MSQDELALELRLRFLESILTPPAPSPSSPASTASLRRRLAQLNDAVEAAISAPASSEAIRHFVRSFDLNEPLLRVPTIANPNPDELPPSTKLIVVLEAEAELRQLERELREIDALDRRGVVGAGDLAQHQPLKPQLEKLTKAVVPLQGAYGALDEEANDLLARYNDYIASLSEVFISWHEIVSAAEDRLAVLERDKAKRDAPDLS